MLALHALSIRHPLTSSQGNVAMEEVHGCVTGTSKGMFDMVDVRALGQGLSGGVGGG